MVDLDEEGIPMNDFDEDDIDLSGGLFESNKKLSFYIIDGGETMMNEDDGEEEGSSFRRATKAIYQQLLKIGCSSSSGLHHMVSVIVANTALSHPPSALGVDHFHDLISLDFISAEAVVRLKEIAFAEDIDIAHNEHFKGYGESDLGSIIYYARRTARLNARSNRQLAVYYITNNANVFGPHADHSSQFRQASRHIADLRTAGGEFSCLYIGQPDDDLTLWRKLDPTISCDTIEELESTVYQKAFAPRAQSILPFEIVPGVSLDVGLYTLAAETKRPTAKYIDAETEKVVQSRTIYRPKEKKNEEVEEDDELTERGEEDKEKEKKKKKQIDDDDEFTEKDDEGEKKTEKVEIKSDSQEEQGSRKHGQPFILGDKDRARSELKQAIALGGEKIIFTQEEIAKLKRFRKGLVLLGFKPRTQLRVDRHVEPAKFLYPNEKTTEGSRRLFRALLERCSAREQVMLCYLNVASHTRPRLVALVPYKDSDCSSDGFHVVFLPMADDCVDGSALDKAHVIDPDQETSEQRAASKAFINRVTAKFEPFENPNLQMFYSMLIEYATGEAPKEVEDTIQPYFSNDRGLVRVEKQLNALQEAFGDLSQGTTKAKGGGAKRGAKLDDDDASRPKRVRATAKNDGTVDLEELAKKGKLSSLTVAVLRESAITADITLTSAKKKDDIIAAINKHYGV